MSLSARGLHPGVRAAAQWALEVAASYGLAPTITSTYRPFAEQAILYRAWRRGRSRFPANPPGQSGHQYGFAWDSVVPTSQLALWTMIRQAAGFHVPPNDVIHAEVPYWPRYVGRR